ncbi:MAG TPA: carbohydrate-binding domain-containing protein [Tepidisphaeraceae bacterium]|nr:carbohydrate-binding domain-containing protein [Tepidisphaeraceae bacterium]
MKATTIGLLLVSLLLLGLPHSAALAAVSHEEAALDASNVEPFAVQVLKYEATEKTGDFPGPWVPGAWADGAVGRIERVADAGDGKPAIRMVNVSGQPSLMFKPWTEVSLARGGWQARVEYRKAGKTNGRLAVGGLGDKEVGVDLPPTGEAFKSVALPLEATGEGAKARPTFQHYSGTGEGEALYVRSFELEQVGDVGAETKAAEAEAAAALSAAAKVVAEREAARRALERKPINGWVRPEHKPVKMDKPLDPPPVTGKTYYVATTGDNGKGDGSERKPWKTIQHGMNQLHPGDRLYVRGGEYRENMITFARSGKPDAYITVAGYPGEKAKVINSGGMAVFNLDAGSPWTPKRLEEQAYLVIRDLHIDAVNGNQGVRINGPMLLDGYKNDVVKSRGVRHNIWVVGCEITGGGTAEGGFGCGYGAHDIVLSNNRVRTRSGMNSFLYSDGTIIEWNTVHDTSADEDDAGAIKSMAPGVIIRYNTVHGNNRSSTSKKPGWAPSSEGGKQWRFLQGVTGIYLDWAMLTPKGGNNFYPKELAPSDPANYVYGNTVYDNNGGIFAFKSDHAQIFDNEVYGNGRANSGGWVEGKEGGKWLEFIGPAGYGIAATLSKDVRVYDNVVYNNRLGGLTTESVPGFQAWNNVLFGNDLAQIDVRKGLEGAFAFNTILDTGKKQGPPVRHLKADFATVESYREKFGYKDEGTRVVRLKDDADPVAAARKLVGEGAAEGDRRTAALDRLTAAALAAGIGKPPATVPQAPYDPTASLQAPLPWRLPGTVEFENYDVGGPGVSFNDNDAENEGGHYRKDAVDVKASPKAGNGAVVGFTANGEWMEYTVHAAKAGDYVLTLSYATPDTGRRVRLSLNDKPLRETITLEPTANWDDLQTVKVGEVSLPAGDGVLRVSIEAGPVDLDRLMLEHAN